MNNKKIRQQFADTALKIGKKDKNIIVIVGDISHGIMQPFAKKYPNRYYNIGICEPGMVNVAAGLSKMDFIPIVHTITPFLIERSFEQIKLDFAYQNLPINLVSVGATFDYSKLGCSHHSYSDFVMINQFEKSHFLYPGSALEFDVLFQKTYKRKAINYFRISDFNHKCIFEKKQIQFGKGILCERGKDLTIICNSALLDDAIEISKKLKIKNITSDIIYLHTLKPIDKNMIIKSAKKTKRIIILENFNLVGGLGSICIDFLKNIKNIKIENIGINKLVHQYGDYQNLKNQSGINQKNIFFKIKKLLNKNI